MNYRKWTLEQQKRRERARKLLAAGNSYKRVALLLGVSRQRVYQLVPREKIRKDGKCDCKSCGRAFHRNPHWQNRAAEEWCRKCEPIKNHAAAKSSQALNAAVRMGLMPPPTDFVCVDCGSPAKVYDHRDYREPFDVDPVCIGCNNSRGPAVGFHDHTYVPEPALVVIARFFFNKRLVGRGRTLRLV